MRPNGPNPTPALALVLALVWILPLAGCSSGGGTRPAPAAAAAVADDEAHPSIPVKIVLRERLPAPLPDVRCDQVVALALAGDHKPVVDSMREIESEGAFCHQAALTAADDSRLLLARADSLIHSSTEKKLSGDVRGARDDLRGALELYPRYHWARKLLRDLGGTETDLPAEAVAEQQRGRVEPSEPADDVEVEVIRQLIAEENLALAHMAERQGNLAAARHWTISAIQTEPEDQQVRLAIVEYARLLGLKFFSAGELSPAREIWEAAYALDQSDGRLRDYLRQVEERLDNLERIRTKDGRP